MWQQEKDKLYLWGSTWFTCHMRKKFIALLMQAYLLKNIHEIMKNWWDSETSNYLSNATNLVLLTQTVKEWEIKQHFHCFSKKWLKGAILVRDNRVFNGPLGRSLHSFSRTAQQRSASLCSLCYARFALLCSLRLLGPFTGSLTHFDGWNLWIYVHSRKYVFTLKTRNLWICVQSKNAFHRNIHPQL